jgi:hypothetical protein
MTLSQVLLRIVQVLCLQLVHWFWFDHYLKLLGLQKFLPKKAKVKHFSHQTYPTTFFCSLITSSSSSSLFFILFSQRLTMMIFFANGTQCTFYYAIRRKFFAAIFFFLCFKKISSVNQRSANLSSESRVVRARISCIFALSNF